nr:unnamed protein product [Spirometra erinaceieuropaei]
MNDEQNSDFEDIGQPAPAGATEAENEQDRRTSKRNSGNSETSVRSRSSAKPPEEEKKPKFAPRAIVWRQHISKESLLPTVNDWVSEWNRHKRMRHLFLLLNLSVCVCFFISHIVSAAIIANHMEKIRLFAVTHTLPRADSSAEQEETEKQPYLVSRLWLSDGGLVTPPKSSDLNPFQKLLLSDLELTEACFNQRRRGRVLERTNGSFSSISGKVVCLEGALPDTTWLTKTPLAWINAQLDYMQRLPRADEERISLLQEDRSISQVESPIGLLGDREAINARFRDIPMVISSTMDQVDLHMSRRNKPTRNMTLLELQNELRNSFSTLSSSTAQVNYVYSIGKAYDPLLRTLSKTHMGGAFNAIVSDLRSICAYNLFAKRLQQFGFVKEGPIYRLLNRLPRPPLRDISGRFCDLPFFLNDGRTGCECRNADLSRWETLRSQSPVLRPFLREFVHTGWVRKFKRMRAPSEPTMPAIETTFNIMGPQGLVTAGGREVSSYTACSEWRVPDEIHVLLKYGRVN